MLGGLKHEKTKGPPIGGICLVSNEHFPNTTAVFNRPGPLTQTIVIIMILDHIFAVTLIFATFTTILVTGIVFTFALLVMPGTGKLADREFLRAFQEMDGIIQRSHPIFITVWVGSNSALLASVILAFGRLDGLPLALLLASTVVYYLGVQLPTILGNIPLNNRLQKLNLETMGPEPLASARSQFERPWNRLNMLRTCVALAVSVTLLTVVLLSR